MLLTRSKKLSTCLRKCAFLMVRDAKKGIMGSAANPSISVEPVSVLLPIAQRLGCGRIPLRSERMFSINCIRAELHFSLQLVRALSKVSHTLVICLTTGSSISVFQLQNDCFPVS